MAEVGTAPCGTYARYQIHRRLKEDECAPCRDAYNAYTREYTSRPEVREKRRAYQAAYAAKKRLADPGYTGRITKAWRIANPDKFKAQAQRWERQRRNLELGAPCVPYTEARLKARLSMYRGCWMCGGQADTIDHVKPLSKGGWDCLANLRPACRSCNSRKRDRWPYPQ